MKAPAPRYSTSQKAAPSLKNTSTPNREAATFTGEESLIDDSRAGSTPAQDVEAKLQYLLRSNPVGMSHLMASHLRTSRPR